MNIEPEEENSSVSASWSVTFSDMALNMLCIFVLMLSFSQLRQAEFQQVAGSVRAAFGSGKPNSKERAKQLQPVTAVAPIVPSTQASAEVDATSVSEVSDYIRAQGLAELIEVEASPRGVVVRVRDRALFESGSALVRDDAGLLLERVLAVYRHFPGTLAVEGHTDDKPIANALYPSNWELSAARAASVLRYLVASGIDAERVHVAGYANLHPIASNADNAGRARNRRVEFVFEPAPLSLPPAK